MIFKNNRINIFIGGKAAKAAINASHFSTVDDPDPGLVMNHKFFIDRERPIRDLVPRGLACNEKSRNGDVVRGFFRVTTA
jgi:hypothetical protein